MSLRARGQLQPEQPFGRQGRWYRGALHTHTANSDGDKTPEEAAAIYKALGYDFICFTDHEVVTEFQSADPDFLCIAGIEVESAVGDGNQDHKFHFTGLGVVPDPAHISGLSVKSSGGPAARGTQMSIREAGSLREVVDVLKSMSAFVSLAHPGWSNLGGGEVLDFCDCNAVEIYNTTADLSIARGFSCEAWDYALTHGGRVNAVAGDDTHGYNIDMAGGWVMVRAEKLQAGAILQRLGEGSYYTTCGPQIENFEVNGGTATGMTSQCKRIDFVCNSASGRSFIAAEGQTIRSAAYKLPAKARYVRLQCSDERGRKAWSNPVYLST